MDSLNRVSPDPLMAVDFEQFIRETNGIGGKEVLNALASPRKPLEICLPSEADGNVSSPDGNVDKNSDTLGANLNGRTAALTPAELSGSVQTAQETPNPFSDQVPASLVKVPVASSSSQALESISCDKRMLEESRKRKLKTAVDRFIRETSGMEETELRKYLASPQKVLDKICPSTEDHNNSGKISNDLHGRSRALTQYDHAPEFFKAIDGNSILEALALINNRLHAQHKSLKEKDAELEKLKSQQKSTEVVKQALIDQLYVRERMLEQWKERCQSLQEEMGQMSKKLKDAEDDRHKLSQVRIPVLSPTMQTEDVPMVLETHNPSSELGPASLASVPEALFSSKPLASFPSGKRTLVEGRKARSESKTPMLGRFDNSSVDDHGTRRNSRRLAEKRQKTSQVRDCGSNTKERSVSPRTSETTAVTATPKRRGFVYRTTVIRESTIVPGSTRGLRKVYAGRKQSKKLSNRQKKS